MKSTPKSIPSTPANGNDIGRDAARSWNQVNLVKFRKRRKKTKMKHKIFTVGTDPLKFDFSAEWSKYWLNRLRQLYEDEIALKKYEIRRKLNLSDDYYPRSSSSTYNEPSSSFGYNTDNTRMEKSRTKSQYSPDQFEEQNVDDEPLTVISVLRLLAALEDLLGATLGKKVLDLLSKAVHLEKLKANLADDVLMNEENSVLLDTVKEKLKGLIIAKIVNNQQINAVRRAIRNVESIVAVIDEKVSVSKVKDETKSNKSDMEMSNDKSWQEKPNSHNSHMDCERRDDSRSEIRKQIATAFSIQKINISKDRLEELTNSYASQSRVSSETPYLFGVRVSQTEVDYTAKSQNSSSHSQSSSHTLPINKQHNLNVGGSGFAFTLFDRNVRNTSSLDNSTFNSTVNPASSSNFLNRTNTLGDSYSQQNSSQSSKFRSPDRQFNQPNSSHQNSLSKSLSQQNNQNQRFQQQGNPNSHQQSQNSPNMHMNKTNHFNQSNQRKQNHLPIWESETMMANQSNSQGFDKNAKINSIWDSNPMQSQSQQPFNQGSFQHSSKQQQQSHYNNFYQQNQQHGMNSHQSIWDHQFPQPQNNRNSRHH